MRLREYEYILAIAREKSVNRAADSLFITQPALSKVLLRVESEVGIPLFERRGREMLPTEAGKIYLEYASQLVAMNDRFEMRMKRNAPDSAELVLAIPLIRNDFVINSVLPQAYRRLPNMPIRILPTGQRTILDHLLHGDYPFALGIVTEEYAQTLSYRLIGAEEMILAVPRGHPLENCSVRLPDCTYPFIDARALADTPFIVSRPDSYSGRFANSFFHAHEIHPPIALQVPLTSSILQSVALGVGVAILPSIPARHMRLDDAVTYLSIRDHSHSHAVGVMFRKERTLSEAEEAFIHILRQAYDSPH